MSEELNVGPLIEATLEALWKHPKYAVCVGGQVRLMKAGYEPKKAWVTSQRCLSEFLRDERISFGNPNYTWGVADGARMVEEYELIG